MSDCVTNEELTTTDSDMRSDRELLQEYISAGCERAFTLLVKRHLNLVYSVALRHCHDHRTAEEVTSNVFLTLVKKARSLKGDVTLTGWLFNSAKYIAGNARGFEERRREWVRQAALQPAPLDESQEEAARAWELVGAQLDAAVDELNESDRAAILLRFYENKSFREVGAELGVNEEAARKRTERALEKLRERLKTCGAVWPVGTLALMISSSAVSAAPTRLVETIAGRAGRNPARVWRAGPALVVATCAVAAAVVAVWFGGGVQGPGPRDVFYEQQRAVLEGNGEDYVRTLHFETPTEIATKTFMVDSVRLRFKLKTLLIQEFGLDAFNASQFPRYFDLFDTNQIALATVQTSGRTATLRTPWGSQLPFVRQGNDWKMDYFRLPGLAQAEDYRRSVERRNAVVGDVTQSLLDHKYKEIREAYRDITMLPGRATGS